MILEVIPSSALPLSKGGAGNSGPVREDFRRKTEVLGYVNSDD